jgi:hypothetical protein
LCHTYLRPEGRGHVRPASAAFITAKMKRSEALEKYLCLCHTFVLMSGKGIYRRPAFAAFRTAKLKAFEVVGK